MAELVINMKTAKTLGLNSVTAAAGGSGHRMNHRAFVTDLGVVLAAPEREPTLGRCVMDEDRRSFFQRSSQLAAGALAVGALASSTSEAQAPAQTPSKKLKIMMRSAWGTDDPTRGSFVFAHALAFADAGHDVQIFLTGEATYLMRKTTVDAVKPIGWPPLTEMMEKVVAKHIPVFS